MARCQNSANHFNRGGTETHGITKLLNVDYEIEDIFSKRVAFARELLIDAGFPAPQAHHYMDNMLKNEENRPDGAVLLSNMIFVDQDTMLKLPNELNKAGVVAVIGSGGPESGNSLNHL